MQKIRWSCLLIRLSELDSATFFHSHKGRMIRKGVVARAERVNRNIRIVSEEGEVFFFPNDDTFAFGGIGDGEVMFKRLGEREWDKEHAMWCQYSHSFRFVPKVPFELPPGRTEEELAAYFAKVIVYFSEAPPG
jgi:hypothetical protein